jgi:hypothetical protein
MFKGFTEQRDVKTSKVAAEAYNVALGPHHGWALRKAATLAMKAINYRKVIVEILCKEQCIV